MFQLEPNPTFTAPVSIPLPGGETATVDFTFAHMGRKELQEFIAAVKEIPDSEALRKIVAGWSGVAGADGKTIPYSADALEALVDSYHAAALAVLQTYFRELTGQRVKN